MNFTAALITQKVLMVLPRPFLASLAGFCACLMFTQGRRRRTAFKNIKTAFPDKRIKDIYKIIIHSFFLFCLSLLECFIVRRLYKTVTMKGAKPDPDGGDIYVGVHAGNWELVNCFFAKNYSYAILAEPQKNKELNAFLNRMRTDEGMRVCVSLRDIARSIKEGRLVGMVVDHGAEDNAPIVNFFSQDVPMPRGALYFARRFKKKIYPCFSYREKHLNTTLEIGEPIEIEGKTDQEVLNEISSLYEIYIKQRPWEYFWCYKRFKYKINRNLLIISDGKTGHLKQSRALSSFLEDDGRYNIRETVVTVRYRRPWMRIIADSAALFIGKHSISAWFWLKIVLDRESCFALKDLQADIVVSSGSYIAGVNKLMASYLGAKSACVLRPNFPLGKFDLTVIPEHDRASAENTVVIKGALTYPDHSLGMAQACKDFFAITQGKKISLFIGGPLEDEQKFIANLRLFIEAVSDFSRKNGYRMLISTSRRTPASCEAYLESLNVSSGLIEVLVIASKNNYDFVFDGFILLSDIVFVTGESISMVSEAVCLSKACVCVLLEDSDNKRKLFLESLRGEVSALEKPYEIRNVDVRSREIFEKNKEKISKRLGVLF
jgi:lauroyl/myristoyl acyltransferase/mitochondrial fission protein ELM1